MSKRQPPPFPCHTRGLATTSARTRPSWAPLLLLVLSSSLMAISTATCRDALAYKYKAVAYNSPQEGGRRYILYDILQSEDGCLNNWATARAVCARDGLELAPRGEPRSLGT